MFCPKCGNQITDNGKFCTSCGTPIATVSPETNEASAQQPIEQAVVTPETSSAQAVPTVQNQPQTTQEDLVKAYIGGNDSEKIYKYLKRMNPKIDGHPEQKQGTDGISWGVGALAGFFGPFYYLYRKMYLMTLPVLALSLVGGLIIVVFKLPSYVSTGLAIGVWLGAFPSVYSYDITRKIKKIQNQYANSPADQLAAIEKAGGTSWLSVLLAIPYIALYFVVALILILIFKI